MSRPQPRINMRSNPSHIAGLRVLEHWLSIQGYDGYFVSNQGRVCSVDRVVKGQICRGKVLRPGAQASGHMTVALGRGNTKGVHVLVLEAFVGPCPDDCECLHWDDNSTNNSLSNLRWGTRSDNLHDAIRNGKRAIGENKSQSKLTEEGVRWIRANSQCSMNSLAVHLGVSCAAVKQVRDGVTWKHVA